MRVPIAGLVALLATPAIADELVLPRCEPGYGQLITTSRIDIPAVGAEGEVELGQSMVSVVRASLHESALELVAEGVFRGSYAGGGFTVTIPPGHLRAVGVGSDGVYEPNQYEFKYDSERRPRTGFSRPVVTILAQQGGLVANVNFGLKKAEYPLPDVEYVQGRCLVYGQDSFRRELLYSGVAQGTISLEYREFVNDMARPAFSQTLRYDLNEGRTIGFRGARFEILDANNISVRYRVLRELE